MNRARTLVAFAATMLVTMTMTLPVAHAHSGHDGTNGDTVMHYLSQPQHAAIIGVVLLSFAVFVVTRFSMSRRTSS